MNDTHEYLTRDRGFVNNSGIVIPRNVPVANYRKLRSRGQLKIAYSDFGIYRHSRYKGQNYFFYSNYNLYELLPFEKTAKKRNTV